MKSKIKFDLNVYNEPILLAEVQHSEDVRDKIAQRFKETFGYESVLSFVSFLPDREHPDGLIKSFEISPIASGMEGFAKFRLFIPDRQISVLQAHLKEEVIRRNKMEESIFFGQEESKMKPAEELAYIYERLGELLGLKETGVINSFMDKDGCEFKLTKYGYEMVHGGFSKKP